MNERLKAALNYLALGWAVVPLSFDAKFLDNKDAVLLSGYEVGTEGWQRIFQPETSGFEVRRWFNKLPDLNIGISMRGSGLAVLDVDDPARFEVWSRTHGGMMAGGPVVNTRKGRHYYFQARETDVSGLVYDRDGYYVADFKAPHAPAWKTDDEAYVVAPPSVVTGHEYRWEIPPSVMMPVLALPPWITVDTTQPCSGSSWYGGDDDVYDDEWEDLMDGEY